MIALAFFGFIGFVFYVEIEAFFQNRAALKRNREYFKNRS